VGMGDKKVLVCVCSFKRHFADDLSYMAWNNRSFVDTELKKRGKSALSIIANGSTFA
jgi:hypothetical protein